MSVLCLEKLSNLSLHPRRHLSLKEAFMKGNSFICCRWRKKRGIKSNPQKILRKYHRREAREKQKL
jgi:hypothetical protein